MPPLHTSGTSAAEAAQEWARAQGRQLAAGRRRLESWMADWTSEGREWLKLGRRFWREIQEPKGRQRHMLALLALAAGAGLVAGFLSSGRREE